MAALFICRHFPSGESIRAMPAAGLAAISAFQQVVLSKNIQTVLDVVVLAFNERVARSRLAPLLFSHQWLLQEREVQD